jgi:hypothetical protein
MLVSREGINIERERLANAHRTDDVSFPLPGTTTSVRTAMLGLIDDLGLLANPWLNKGWRQRRHGGRSINRTIYMRLKPYHNQALQE